MNVQHLDGEVKGENIGTGIDGREAALHIEGYIEGTREIGVQALSRIEIPGRRGEREGGRGGKIVASFPLPNPTHLIEGISIPILLNLSLSVSGIWSGCRDIRPKVPPPSLKS